MSRDGLATSGSRCSLLDPRVDRAGGDAWSLQVAPVWVAVVARAGTARPNNCLVSASIQRLRESRVCLNPIALAGGCHVEPTGNLIVDAECKLRCRLRAGWG